MKGLVSTFDIRPQRMVSDFPVKRVFDNYKISIIRGMGGG